MKLNIPILRSGLVYFVMFTIYGVATPYLQILVRGLGYSPAAVGVLLGLFEIAGVAWPLALGGLIDRVRSPRPVLLGMSLVAAAALLPLVLLRQFVATTLALAILALGIRGLIPFADAAAVSIAEAGAAEHGPAGYGKIRVFGSAGFIVTVLVLQAIPDFDRSPPGRIALFLAGAIAAFCAILPLFPLPIRAPKAPAPRAGAPARRVDPVFALGLAIIALGRIAMAPISSFISLYATEELK